MEDNFEWEEYKEKVDELTRKFEELKDQVSGEAAEGSFDLFSGVEATPPRQNITHYVGNLGDTLSIGNYQELKNAFEVFVKASEADGRVKVLHGDTLVGSAGTNDKIYCLVTVADEASLSGFQSSSPAPFNGEHVWGYHIWTSASGSCNCCPDGISTADIPFPDNQGDGLSSGVIWIWEPVFDELTGEITSNVPHQLTFVDGCLTDYTQVS